MHNFAHMTGFGTFSEVQRSNIRAEIVIAVIVRHTVYMKKMKSVLIVFLVGLFLLPQHALARCKSLPLPNQVRQVDLIMTGTVESQEFVGYNRAGLPKGGVDTYAEARNETPLWKWRLYKFIPDKVFKGEKNAFELIVSPRKFSSGGRYIIFAKKNKGLARYKNTMASYVNEQCDPAEYLYPLMGSDLLEDTEDYFSTMQFR